MIVGRQAMTEAVSTTNHTVIRNWTESRNGRPALAADGILRIDFQEREEQFEEIDWDRFFDIFEDRKLAFLHQDMLDDGKISRFNKFVQR